MAGPYFVIAKVEPDYTWWEIDGPNNLGDDEDKIVGELNRLAAENAALRAEVERLREECDFWRSHLHIDSPKMDGQHTWRLMWNHFTLVGSDAGEVVRNALEAIRSQPLPAPPDK